MFKVFKESKKSCARAGVLKTKSGDIKTPFFMPIATRGVIKSISFLDIKNLNPEIILSNTYHLYLKPGLKVIKKASGLHGFMNCNLPILTDSGGFQVFSLSKIRKISDKGVEFQSTYDGSKHFFTPEKVMKIQSILNSDIQMVLDVCIDSKSSRLEIEKALDLTTFWAKKCKSAKIKLDTKKKNLLFGIIQGGLHKDLRKKSLDELLKIGFDGYAIGGLAVGETNDEMYDILDYIVKDIPHEKPRYLMGVGYPENIVNAIKSGVDMFDCVIPTREARHGRLYIRLNNNFDAKFYKTINITKSSFSSDMSKLNINSKIKELREYSKAYINHLFRVQDPLALRMATLNNIEFYLDLLRDIRKDILDNNF
ncbi:MAG: tRNA guanosine(34) transglycosylase Tgt [Patescibacteria group bacterium]|nr:tRNA guanosine(34) transglycosylase Tgt [Patescibacteria group bacterium]